MIIMSVAGSIKEVVPGPQSGKGIENGNASWFLIPLTPKSIATFNNAKFIILLVNWIVFGCICSFFITKAINKAIISSITTAVQNLPQKGEIKSGALYWETNQVFVLSGAKSFSISVNATDEEDIADSSDIQIIIGKNHFRFRSIFGWLEIKYPLWFRLPLSYKEVFPVWDAYMPAIKASVFISSMVVLLIVWTIVSLIYSLFAKFLIRLFNRISKPGGAFKISGASLIPAALVMSIAILGYSLRYLDLLSLLIVFGCHFIISLCYLFLSIFHLEKIPMEDKNPFSSSKTKQDVKKDNPFAG